MSTGRVRAVGGALGGGGGDRGVGAAVDELLHLAGELLAVLDGGVGAAGGLRDAAELVAGVGVRDQAEGVDDQVDALGGDVAGHVAGVGRAAGVLAVGDQDEPAGAVAALEVVGGREQRGADRGPAGGLEGGDGGLGLGRGSAAPTG